MFHCKIKSNHFKRVVFKALFKLQTKMKLFHSDSEFNKFMAIQIF